MKFEVEGTFHEVNCTIDVKQGDVLGPVLFIMFMAGVMTSWRNSTDCPSLTFFTREDFTLTGRKHTDAGQEFTLDDSEYADDTAALFDPRENTQK